MENILPLDISTELFVFIGGCRTTTCMINCTLIYDNKSITMIFYELLSSGETFYVPTCTLHGITWLHERNSGVCCSILVVTFLYNDHCRILDSCMHAESWFIDMEQLLNWLCFWKMYNTQKETNSYFCSIMWMWIGKFYINVIAVRLNGRDYIWRPLGNMLNQDTTGIITVN